MYFLFFYLYSNQKLQIWIIQKLILLQPTCKTVLSLAKCEIKIKIQRIAWEILVIDNAMINEHGNARSRKTMENVWWIQTLSWLDFRLQLIWIWLVQIGSSMGAFKSQIMSVIYLIIPTNWNTIHSYPVQKAHDF